MYLAFPDEFIILYIRYLGYKRQSALLTVDTRLVLQKGIANIALTL